MSLIPIAAIVLGSSLLLSSGTASRMSALVVGRSTEHETFKRVAREAVYAAAGGQVMLGLGAIILGILALVGMAAITLTLVALLAIGASTMMSGAAISSRMLSGLESQ